MGRFVNIFKPNKRSVYLMVEKQHGYRNAKVYYYYNQPNAMSGYAWMGALQGDFYVMTYNETFYGYDTLQHFIKASREERIP